MITTTVAPDVAFLLAAEARHSWPADVRAAREAAFAGCAVPDPPAPRNSDGACMWVRAGDPPEHFARFELDAARSRFRQLQCALFRVVVSIEDPPTQAQALAAATLPPIDPLDLFQPDHGLGDSSARAWAALGRIVLRSLPGDR